MFKPASQKEALLIIVCCHSIFHGTDPYDDTHWNLASFQKTSGSKPAENLTFLAHIREAVQLYMKATTKSASTPSASRPLIIFSGGHTSSKHPDYSEAAGYLRAAEHLILNEDEESCRSIKSQSTGTWAATEDFATDSYQNVLFSVLRYWQICGRFPQRIVVVTHAFKTERIKMHADAINWTNDFNICGIDPPFDEQERMQVIILESKNARDLFRLDPYGAHSPLRDKRVARRWDEAVIDHLATGHSAAVNKLLRWTGGEDGKERFLDELPWSRTVDSLASV